MGLGRSAAQPIGGGRAAWGDCLERTCMWEKLFGVCSYQENLFPQAFWFLPGVDKDKDP